MKNLKKTAILALIGAALALQGAKAQISPAAAKGDLIFGAENIVGGTASGKDDEVDLGSINQFTLTSNLTFSQVTAGDLTAALGTIGANSVYSVAGTTGTSLVGLYGENSVFITSTIAPPATTASSYNGLSSSAIDIGQVYNGLNQAAGFTAGSNSRTGILTIGSSGNTYSDAEGTAGGGTTPFGQSISDDVTLLNGGQLNLYVEDTATFSSSPVTRNTQGPITDLGYFQYNNNVLTFTGADAGVGAIPEPSTYALMLGGLGVLGFLNRRRLLNS